MSYLRFIKGGKVQKIIYKIKYEGRKEGAYQLGKWYGWELTKHSFRQQFDLILPVPLHKKKLRKRGFNQSDWFASGLSEVLGVEWSASILAKVDDRSSQTNKSRWKRWINAQELYVVVKPEAVRNKRILLVDDVVTTGSTLEACSLELFKAGAAEVSIATIACAM
ncbi:MAG TPA: phosphoribosyltransferase family protein [Cytophagaceae bacterium]